MRWVALSLVPLFVVASPSFVSAKDPPKSIASKTAHVLEALQRVIEFPTKGDENLLDNKMTLGEFLSIFGDRYELDFSVDEAAFSETSNDKADRLPLEAKIFEKPLYAPGVVKVPFEDFLRQTLARVPVEGGATFMIERGTIVLTTVPAQRARIWGKEHKGPYPPVIHANFDRIPLAEALRDIAAKGNVTLIVSDVVAEKMRMPITTQLINAPLDTAAVMLADIADFQPVFRHNMLYITTRENAARLEKEFQERDREAKPQLAKPSPAPAPMKPAR
jgi:hypothetical protein